MPPDYVQDRHAPALTLAHTYCSYVPGKHKDSKMVLLAKMRLSLLQILQVCVMNWKSIHSKNQGTIRKFTPCLNWWTLICVKEIQRTGEPGNKFIQSSVYPFIHSSVYPFIHSSFYPSFIHSTDKSQILWCLEMVKNIFCLHPPPSPFHTQSKKWSRYT